MKLFLLLQFSWRRFSAIAVYLNRDYTTFSSFLITFGQAPSGACTGNYAKPQAPFNNESFCNLARILAAISAGYPCVPSNQLVDVSVKYIHAAQQLTESQ
jgi:hypothetical protein